MSFQGSTFFSALNKIGIESARDYYRDGNWFGNSSLDGITIYKYVTYNMSELLNSIDILYDNGKKEKVSNDNLDSLKPRTINSLEYGRCYELVFSSIYNSILYIDVNIKRNLEIYIDIPLHFYTSSKYRIFANAEKRIYITVTYEILKINFGRNHRDYSSIYAGSYDECKTFYMEDMVQGKYNCTVPSMTKSGNICVGPVAKNASKTCRVIGSFIFFL